VKKPAAANGKPAAANGKKPAAKNGNPATAGGKRLAAANGKRAAANNRSNPAPARPTGRKRDRSGAERRNTETKRTPRNGAQLREDANGVATEANRNAPAPNGNAPAANRTAPAPNRGALAQARFVNNGRTTNGPYAIPTSNGSGAHPVTALESATTVVRLKPARRLRRSGSSACPAPVLVTAHPLKRSSRKGALLVLGAAGLAVSAVAAAGLHGDDENRASRIASNGLSIGIPAGWERVAPPTARLEWLSGTIGAAASDGSGAAIASGLMREQTAGHRAIRALLPDGATGKTVDLGRVQAKRYSHLNLGSGSTGIAYVVHTTGPSLAVVCRAPTAKANGLAAECSQAAATVTLDGERPVSPAVAARRGLLVRRAVRTLSAERAAGRRRVAAAPVAVDQEKAVRALQASYIQAAGRVDLTGAYGPRIAALSAALRAAGNGYGDLADSISAGDQPAYDAARAAVLEAETEVWGASAAN
jgi:hypothetical protein